MNKELAATIMFYLAAKCGVRILGRMNTLRIEDEKFTVVDVQTSGHKVGKPVHYRHLWIRRAVLSSLLAVVLLPAHAEDTSYRLALKSAHERYQVLSTERNDYRKDKPALPATQEDEYLRVLGQLLIDDPIWALGQQIQADIDALVALRVRTPADNAALENFKDFLAITSAVEGRAVTRKDAELSATTLRQFLARRDISGARAWARSQ